ncbi:hypothetical protein ACHQM5_024245 [Ranunculus cassubicifolius]
MGCDGIQPSLPFSTITGKSLDLIISELQYQGVLSEDQARRMPEEDLRSFAEKLRVILHKDKEYNYVEYYSLSNLSPDIVEKLLCPKDVNALAELNHVEIELWNPDYKGIGNESLCIKGLTRDSVQRTRAGLDSIKDSFYPFVFGKRAYPYR